MSDTSEDDRAAALDALARGLAVLVIHPGDLPETPGVLHNPLVSIEVVKSGYLPANAEWAIIPKDWHKSQSGWWVEYRAEDVPPEVPHGK